MGLASKIEGIISVVNELEALKTALGIPDTASVTDVVAEIKSLATAVASLAATPAVAAAPVADAQA